MKKFPLAALAGAVLSANVSAFEITSDGDWNVRWDNTLKGNLMFRTAKQDADVYNSPTAGHLADDSTFSVDRSNLGVVSSRIDVLSELDVVFKDNFGFRVSGSGWYDYAYKDADNPASNILTWASPSVAVGEYSDEAKDMHYRGGELLDAFVFGNIDIGETSLGIRAGRHTIYWGNSLLAGGAIASIGGSMAPIDFSKAFSVPGTGAKELFMPYGKVSAVWQLTDNLTLNGYYGYEHRRHRLPESGTFFSPAEGLAEKTEFITLPVDPKALAPGVFARVGLESYGDQVEDKEWGVNVQYYFEDLGLETSFIYLNYVDKNLHGLHGGIDATKFADFGGTPVVNPAQRTITVGSGRWLFKDDIDLYGISLSKEIAGISTGLDIVYRKNTGLAPDLAASLGRFYNVPAPLVPAVQASGSGVIEGDFFGYDSENYLGPVGDTVSVVANGLGLLSDNGIWEGGSYI
ncbi:MAG: DUF1302 domain-containing protein, partial [Cellvibrionaceae bacterium]|nr:DUF1302 domain-containing protein [Cellvibrionaceae bacterium]